MIYLYYVGQFSVHILETDKILGFWLSFYVNRLEPTAELDGHSLSEFRDLPI